MAKKKQVAAVQSAEQTAAKTPPATRWFRAVVQADESGQMDVLRWLANDACYEVCYILHDKDVKQADDEDEDETKGLEVGQAVKPHYHMIVRVPKKISAQTMTKRFGGYVHFQRCSDPFDYARYLTHEVFRARNKHRYSRDAVLGDLSFYAELLSESAQVTSCCNEWYEALKENDNDTKKAFAAVCRTGNTALIKSIMSHSYFYERFF